MSFQQQKGDVLMHASLCPPQQIECLCLWDREVDSALP